MPPFGWDLAFNGQTASFTTTAEGQSWTLVYYGPGNAGVTRIMAAKLTTGVDAGATGGTITGTLGYMSGNLTGLMTATNPAGTGLTFDSGGWSAAPTSQSPEAGQEGRWLGVAVADNIYGITWDVENNGTGGTGINGDGMIANFWAAVGVA